MREIVLKLKYNWKCSFCIGLIVASILFFVILLIKQPMKKDTNYIYNTGVESEFVEIEFPLKQHIKVNSNYLTTFTIYLHDDSINQYNYKIELKDEDGKIYFQNDYVNYESNIIILGLGVIPDSADKEFELDILCEDCNGVTVASRESNNQFSYIDDTENQSLEISYEFYSKNYIYYWYPLMAILIAFTLYPLAKEEENEKK